MQKYYMLLLQEYTDEKLTDNFYLKDTVYPGTVTYPTYEEAKKEAKKINYETGPNTRIECIVILNNKIGKQ
jgi:hypothetical protein